MLADKIPYLIRTYTPVVVGLVVTWLAQHFHVIIGKSTSDTVVLLIGGAAISLYYTVVKLLEPKFPWMTWLLGSGVQPAAATADGTLPVAPSNSLNATIPVQPPAP